jgi:predicted  nucleic acid-binding Zn-ribbon protein
MDRDIKVNKKLPSYLERAGSGGLFVGFIYVVAFMSILLLGIWQTFESENNKSTLTSIDERISLIEEQINIVDETNNDSMTDITSSIQFLDKEIRKLWDLSNKRNKVDIKKLTEQLTNLDKLFSKLQKDVEVNQLNLNSMKKNIDLNLSKIDELGLSAEDLQSLRLSLSNINTQLMLLDDSVQALNNYKNQLNQVILEIQTQVSSIQNQSIGNN